MSIQRLNTEIDRLTHKITSTKNQSKKKKLEEQVIKLVNLKILLQKMEIKKKEMR